VPVLCYNFMQADWTRTSTQVPARGGALTNEFDLRAMSGKSLPPERCFSPEAMWENLSYFLEKLLPVAEESNVLLAMHPDDPPLPELMGSAQIMYSPACYDRLFADFPSPNNAMCFCQGTFAEMGGDIPELIRHFAGRIGYVHFRDVRGDARHFVETFHDEGQTDMFAAMRAYREIGYAGVARPDHVPRLEGEEGDGSGYSMLGRLFAVGYMRGLIEAAGHPTLHD
jgi:mannonate dehydratase